LSPYGKSKLDAEKEIEKFAIQNDIDAISLRMFNVYDLKNGKQSGVIPKFIADVSNDMPIVINGDGKQTRDFISIEDIVSAFDCAMKNIDGKKGNTYNIATGNSVSIQEIAEKIIAKSGKEIEIIHQDPMQGDIKNSKALVALAEKELGFVAKHNVSDDLSKKF
jgi:UDP-glucose 4-epimerase